ncbi:MAG: DNA topoisomerase IV subunit A [Theionarchaea archaeon]|nr:DNA topoisomerase IV subunit A [Theionarchaea archaeon]
MNEVTEKLEQFGLSVYEQINKERSPFLKIPQRGLSNVSFDEKNRMLALGNKASKRYYLNVAHTRKFMQTILVASYCRRLVEEGRHAGIRELYYALKHSISGTRENTFDDQTESNAITEDIEVSMDLLREQLNLTADRRGYLYGDVLIKDGEDEFNASKLGRGGWAVPGTVEDIEFPEVSAEYMLVVETAAMADRLIEEKFAQKNGALIVACQGQAPRGVRRLIQRLHFENKLPVIVFTDGDPYGWYIYSTIKQGSMNLAYLSKRLSVPDAVFVGMTMKDIEVYGLKSVTERLKATDKSRIKELKSYEWFKHKKWQKELDLCLKLGVRIEQQALANKSLEFVAKEYLPEKIEHRNFLP